MLMNFRPVKPVRRVVKPQDSLDKFVHDFFGSMDKEFPARIPGAHVKRNPATNVLESEEAYTIELAAPGFKKENFSLKVEKEVLTIELKAAEQSEKEDANVYKVREFYFNDFKKAFTLPETVDVDKISAKYENGVLQVQLPKKEEAKPLPPKQIEIA